MPVNLASLENFLLVAEQGSLSRAASIAGIAQPTLGRQIQKIESDCACRLFYRHGRGVTLTPEGELYLRRVQPLVRQLRAAGEELERARGEISGNVTVGMSPVPLELLGLSLLASVRRECPKVRLNIVSGYSGFVHEWLLDGRLDIAVLHDARRSSHIRFDPLAECDLFLISSPGSLVKAERAAHTISFARLANYPLVLPSRVHGLRRTIDDAAAAAGVTLQVEYEIDALPLVKKQVLAGAGHTVLAYPAVLPEMAEDQIVARRIVSPDLKTTLGLAIASSRPHTRAMRAVIQQLRNEMAAVVARKGTQMGVRLDDTVQVL